MRVLIIGLGSIGQRHLRLLKEHFSYEIFAKRHKKPEKKENFGIKSLFSWEEVDEYYFDVAFICNPTYLHIETAIECAKRKMHLFIEKPIDCKLDRLDELLDIVDKKELTSYVVYPMRHIPGIKLLKAIMEVEKDISLKAVCETNLNTWRLYPTYSLYRGQGGGALLELSHEIDMLNYLLGPVKAIRGKVERRTNITKDAEDFAELFLSHETGNESCALLDIGNKRQSRYIEMSFKHHTWTEHLKVDDSIYLNQLKYFFNNLNNSRMMNNLFEASELFKQIIKFRDENPINNLCP